MRYVESVDLELNCARDSVTWRSHGIGSSQVCSCEKVKKEPLFTMATKRNTLCLADKMKVIEYAKQNNAGTRKIAEVFKCGRTQIQMILKNQESITHEYETNAPSDRKRSRGPQYEDIQYVLYACSMYYYYYSESGGVV